MFKFLNLKLKFAVLFTTLLILFPLGSFADRSTAGDINNFDIQPRTITANQRVNVNFKVTVYGKADSNPNTQSDFLRFCEVSSNQSREVKWSVFERLSNGQDRQIQEGRFFYNPFTYNDLDRDISFSRTLPDLAGSRTFYAQLRCRTNRDPLVGSIMAPSAGVTLTQNASTGTGPDGQPVNPGTDFSFPNPLQTDTIYDLLDAIIQFAYRIGLPIAVAVIVYSGILFLAARGNPTTVTKARTILMYAVIGLAILFIGKGFLTLIESILNIGT